MLFWKARSAWHPAANSDDLVASNFFPASQAEALDVEILSSSQGSRIVNMEKSSIVYSFLVRAHNLQILRIEQGSTPRIDPSIFATLLFVAIANTKRCTLSFSCFAPHHGRLFRPLNPIVISVTVIRRDDVALPSISATVFMPPRSRADHCWAPCCLHQIPNWVNWPLQPRNGYKMEPFNRNRRYESSISIRARHYHCSCFSSS
jgi:hypothetical protein